MKDTLSPWDPRWDFRPGTFGHNRNALMVTQTRTYVLNSTFEWVMSQNFNVEQLTIRVGSP